MFFSMSTHAVDAKGRVFLPAKWRGELTASVVITIDENCTPETGYLQCLSATEWAGYIAQFKVIARIDEFKMGVLRLLYAHAFPVETDKQGRIFLSQELRTYSDITDEALLVGVGDRIEIWNPERFASYKKDVSRNAPERWAQISETMKERI